MKTKRLLSQPQWGVALALSLSALALSPSAGRASALGSNVSAFTYTGNQTGFTTNTVYMLSTYNDYLGFCQLSPDSTQSTGYSSQCQTGMGTPNSNMYSAVSYLGTTNNPNNTFIVGDNSGKIWPANLNFNNNNTAGEQFVTSVSVGSSQQVCTLYGSGVSNLVVDPNGQWLYVGCSQNIPFNTKAFNEGGNNTWVRAPGNNLNYNLPGFQLWNIPIESNGSLGTPVLQLQFSENFFTYQGANLITSGFWDGVSPVIRAYPPNSPVLGNSAYHASGAVLVSGLIGDLDENNNYMPVNSGLICSNGSCQVAYNLEFDNGVITAAEAGVDYFNGDYNPALYYNVVNQAGWSGGLLPPFLAEINWSKSDNKLYSCNTNIFSIAPFNNNGTSSLDCSGSDPVQLQWAAQEMPAAGNGAQVDISNLMFVPTPSDIPTPYINGLLTIGTWTSGYVALHAPSEQNNSTAMIFGGSVGSNVNSFLSDVNGNTVFATSSSGLFLYNAFPAQNDATLGSITLIPNSQDNGLTSNKSLLQKSRFVLNIVTKIGEVAAASTVTGLGASTPQSDPIHDPVINNVLESDAVALKSDAVASLENILGTDRYHGQFLYPEVQLKEMGVDKGTVIKGIAFRAAQGIFPVTGSYQYFNSFKISLGRAKTKNNDLREAFSKNIDNASRKVTVKSKLFISSESFVVNKSYPGYSDTGNFSSPILFGAPFKYTGGDLVVDIQHSSLGTKDKFSIDAIATPNQQGVYKLLGKGEETHGIRAVPVVEFIK